MPTAPLPRRPIAPPGAPPLRKLEAGPEIGRQPALLRTAENRISIAPRKRTFLDGGAHEATSAPSLLGGTCDADSADEINAGTLIPVTMLGGVNSGLPGTYDNSVTTSQQRMLVACSRIIPDSSSIDLRRMSGTDQSGLAELSGR